MKRTLIALFAMASIGAASAQSMSGSVYSAPLEAFNLCKNLAASVVYKLDQKVVATALDMRTVSSPELLNQKRSAINKSFSDIGVSVETGVSEEYFKVLNFYLTKNNTLDMGRMNKFLTKGNITDVQVTCRDSIERAAHEALELGEMEVRNPVLFRQKL